ncbi:ATP-binding SpoIIE family protein phosphatase [Streptomyces lancefieldiae]|uniref:SpoIIE family protein phosphatase n=1 Tax=Streptomyces lancefieldiae TaxID=3075520 RepID=A0ABU3AV23_9ACTN|nr:SpoIIE family protein phosphatase [Streptomyces sp. DSM 40712]MDT0614048.1 SpoIIE family protein phosphatase [Streptomyces sp. DSM 40712]
MRERPWLHERRPPQPLVGGRRALKAALRPVTEAVRARRRLAWLNEAGMRIGTTLDLRRTAEELAGFTVPELADGCAVDLLESVLRFQEGDRLGRRSGTGIPELRAMAVCEVPGLDLAPDPVGEVSVYTADRLVHRCLATRKPVLVTHMESSDFHAVAPTPEAADLMRRARVHSYLAVPLIARGVLLGLADFVRAGSRSPFTRADVALVMQLASRAAVYIDNARLYGREREHVVTLQRALLPRSSPSTPGLDVSSSYVPAGDPAAVGGDWFDVVALPSGRTALMVGDVMGRGLAAAATMGRLRTVARTLMALDIAPERLLSRLDLAARDLEEDQVATCLCAVYDPCGGSFRIASAGHPPPLLTGPDGTASFLDVPVGAPLGTGVIPYDPVDCPVPERGRLTLYTDGLIRSRATDLTTQMDRLRRAVAEDLPGDGTVCQAVTDRVGGDRSDDAIVLVAAARPLAPGDEVYVRTLLPDGKAAGQARAAVRERLAAWGLEDLVDTTELVVSELVGNALRYGNAPGELRLLRHERLSVEVSDSGPDLPQIQHAGVSDESGRGLQLINMLCRRWGSCRTPDGKVVWAEQDLPVRAGLPGPQ